MNPKESLEVTVETLLALRKKTDALRLITEKLRVKEMGPADHIRTKHEVKTFVESGDMMAAQALITQAQERALANQTLQNRQNQDQRRGHNLAP